MVKKNTELDLTALEWINENHIMFLNERGLLNENLTDKVKRVKRNIKKKCTIMKGHVKGHIAIITDDVKKSHEAAVDRLYPKLDPLVISSFLEEVQTSLIEKNYIVPASILGKRIMAFNYAYQMYQSYTSVFPDQPVSEKINKYWDHLVMGIEIAKREGYYIGEGEYAKYRNAVVLDDHVFFGNEGRKK